MTITDASSPTVFELNIAIKKPFVDRESIGGEFELNSNEENAGKPLLVIIRG